ncbi:MAG: pectinacetylesterase family protein [Actinobacteria bacterium]|nr:pectinacetylesterase family protein [Actinomycetota bacterium]
MRRRPRPPAIPATDASARSSPASASTRSRSETWVKEEAKAVKKNATCDESTSTSTEASTAVNDAVALIAGEPGFTAATDYIAAAMKARGKYIKDATKDPGKAKMNEKIGDASAKFLTGAGMTVTSAAASIEADLVELTTTAPNYPTTFQTIEPTLCTANVCEGGSGAACATNADCSVVPYGKVDLTPSCVDGDPYMYFARKGTSNNVLMYYQGGGACWDKTSCYDVPGSTCSRTATLADSPDGSTTGFADYNNPSNPFADWNIVFVTYCTCDVHWGDRFKSYGPGQQGRHYGRVNAALAEKFAREHFVDPDRVFSTGSSAGSYGAIMNSYWLMKDVWPNADHAVLGDAGVGVITQGFLDDFIGNWGVDKNFPEDLPGVILPVQNLSLVDLIDGLAQAYPNARFANYDASFDGGSGSQIQFFDTMRKPVPPGNFLTDWGSWWESACEWNACMRDFKAENFTRADAMNDNYRYFTGAGSRHTMFGSDKVYTETKSTNAVGTGVTIVEWVNAMIDNTPAWENVDCANLNGDCNLTNSCQGGTNAGGLCTTNLDCPGGSCQHDPDVANPPFNNDDTVNCGPTDCPCGPSAGVCFGGTNDGGACTSNTQCTNFGKCIYVRCPTP